MKNVSIKILISVVFVLLPILAYAGSCNTGACSSTKIKRIVVSRDLVNIRVEADTTPLMCNAGQYNYLKLSNDHRNFDAIYSLLLSAKLADKPVSIRLNSSTSNCEIAYVYID